MWEDILTNTFCSSIKDDNVSENYVL